MFFPFHIVLMVYGIRYTAFTCSFQIYFIFYNRMKWKHGFFFGKHSILAAKRNDNQFLWLNFLFENWRKAFKPILSNFNLHLKVNQDVFLFNENTTLFALALDFLGWEKNKKKYGDLYGKWIVLKFGCFFPWASHNRINESGIKPSVALRFQPLHIIKFVKHICLV